MKPNSEWIRVNPIRRSLSRYLCVTMAVLGVLSSPFRCEALTNRLQIITDFIAQANVDLQAGDSSFGPHVASPDLNHDGLADVAILGVRKTGSGVSEGAVFLARGTRGGLVIGGTTPDALPAFLDRSSFPAPLGVTVRSDFKNLVAGDFNGDGFEDLAIAGEDRFIASGVLVDRFILVVMGNNGPRQTIHVLGVVGNRFGGALAAGDVNGDGRDDLVVGTPDHDVGNATDVGLVQLFLGTTSGLGTSATTPFATLPHDNLANSTTTASSHFEYMTGSALAVGDFNNDGFDDIAAGAPGGRHRILDQNGNEENCCEGNRPGAVYIRYGHANASPELRMQRILETRTGVFGGGVENLNVFVLRSRLLYFGSALAAGDFNGDGRDDLAVGLPFRVDLDIATSSIKVPAVAVFDVGLAPPPAGGFGNLGSPRILHPFPDPFVVGNIPANSFFGTSLQAGDFSGDGLADLAVSDPGTDQMWLFFGTPLSCFRTCVGGLTAASKQALTAGVFGLNPAGATALPNAGVHFPVRLPAGSDFLNQSFHELATLAAGDLDDDGRSDLLIGVPAARAFVANPGAQLTLLGLGAACVRFGAAVGQFTLNPRDAFAVPDQVTPLQLVWQHPVQWRLLNEVHFRFINDQGVFAWVRFDEDTGQLSLYDDATADFGASGPFGAVQTLTNANASVNLGGVTLVGSGPQGVVTTMTLPITFTGDSKGQRLRVEMFATDDLGSSQGWDPAGSVTVLSSPGQPYLRIEGLGSATGNAALRFNVHCLPGARVRIERSLDLATWTSVKEVDSPTGVVTYESPVGGAAREFLRAVAP